HRYALWCHAKFADRSKSRNGARRYSLYQVRRILIKASGVCRVGTSRSVLKLLLVVFMIASPVEAEVYLAGYAVSVPTPLMLATCGAVLIAIGTWLRRFLAERQAGEPELPKVSAPTVHARAESHRKTLRRL